MKKSDFERMGGTYHWEGDYILPDLIAPESPHIGVWGLRRRNFLIKNRKPIYTGMLLSGKLNAHLEEIDRSADQMFFWLVEQMSVQEDITEALKAEKQMEWVRYMNAIHTVAEEAVLRNLIYC